MRTKSDKGRVSIQRCSRIAVLSEPQNLLNAEKVRVAQ